MREPCFGPALPSYKQGLWLYDLVNGSSFKVAPGDASKKVWAYVPLRSCSVSVGSSGTMAEDGQYCL